jgi:hypothetical protein
MKTNQEPQAFYCINKKKILKLIIRFIRLQKVLGLCDRNETGRLEKEKEKEKTEGVDYTPQLFISCDEKAVGGEEGNEDRVHDAIAYCCALLRSTLRYHKNQITPCEKKKKKD